MRIGLIALAALAAGCVQQPHNNVLLFGTDTKVALDVSSSATSGGAPQLTLGYRRAEAVWMPLVANEQTCDANGDCRTATASSDGSNEPKVLEGLDFRTNGGRDSYSVFASFGAKFSGEATPGGAGAQGGLAQFFATGIAAQRLASNPGVETVLKVNNGDAADAESTATASEADAAAQTAASDAALGKERAKLAADFKESDGLKLAAVRGCVLSSATAKANFIAAIPSDVKTANDKFLDDEINRINSEARFTSWWQQLSEETEKPIAVSACEKSTV